MAIIKEILDTPIADSTSSRIMFENTHDAAQHNWSLLQQYTKFGKEISADNNYPLRYDFEFRPFNPLEKTILSSPDLAPNA